MRVATCLGDLYVEDNGDLGDPVAGRPTVLLWHSFLHNGGMWREQLPMLRKTHRVLNVDAPGHGRSAPLRRPFVMVDCARAATEVLDAANVERASFLGLSWGGMTALATAVHYPKRVDSLMVMDSSARTEPRKNRLKYAILGKIFGALGAAPLIEKRVDALFFSDDTLVTRRDLVEELHRHVHRMDRESVTRALDCIFERVDLTKALRAVHLPTLVIVGALDRAQPIEESQAIALAIPQAELAVVPRAAHLAALEQPELVNGLLREFLERLQSKARPRPAHATR